MSPSPLYKPRRPYFGVVHGHDLKALCLIGAHREEQLLLSRIGDSQAGVIPEAR